MSCARAMSWRVVGAFGRGDSGIEFGGRVPVSESGRGCVRGAEMPRSSERESCRLVDLDRSGATCTSTKPGPPHKLHTRPSRSSGVNRPRAVFD